MCTAGQNVYIAGQNVRTAGQSVCTVGQNVYTAGQNLCTAGKKKHSGSQGSTAFKLESWRSIIQFSSVYYIYVLKRRLNISTKYKANTKLKTQT